MAPLGQRAAGTVCGGAGGTLRTNFADRDVLTAQVGRESPATGLHFLDLLDGKKNEVEMSRWTSNRAPHSTSILSTLAVG